MADKDYIKLILTHIGIGFCIFFFPFLAKIYAFLIIAVGLYFVIKNKNKNNEALLAAAYVAGSEVFLRATSGNPFYEYGKYFIVFFIILGIIHDRIPKRNNPYWLYLLLLVPGVISAIEAYQTSQPNILFNISGPVCLGVCALYTYERKTGFSAIHTILLSIGLPVVSFTAYLFLKCPLTNFIIGNTESNYLLSGDYAPNQTATILGLGMAVFTIRLFLVPSSKKILAINILLLAYIYYRTLLTFSRGGAITAIIVIFAFFFVLLMNNNQRKAIRAKIVGFLALLIAGFWLTSLQTGGLLYKRYAEQNLNGKPKQEEKYSRKKIAAKEIRLFEKNPVFGVGVGESTVIRKSETGIKTISHSEITRMLAEHGAFGIVSLLILAVTPLLLFLKREPNPYLICFLVFWALTINHSAMRIGAPAFLYALALLSAPKKEEVSSV
jgi:hypothetical protein